jgi:pyrroloquinoline quinone biosynthesis protein B
MRAVVLGAAAGGGFPQWNSNASACRRARAGDPAAPARTQASVAVSGDGAHWAILNASPDLREQINRSPFLHPAEGLRSTPISDVLLTGGDVDVLAGLLTLRERQPFTLWATRTVHDVLDANPIFEVLARDVVDRRVAELGAAVPLGCGLTAELFPVPGKTPLYLEEGGDAPPPIETGETTVAALISDGRRNLVYAPGCAEMTPALASRLRGADLVFFDGTLWRDDEMIAAGLGRKTGRRMGHISMSGPEGAIAALRGVTVGRKVFIHINNSNPVLLADSAERAAAEREGWEIAYDGLEIVL